MWRYRGADAALKTFGSTPSSVHEYGGSEMDRDFFDLEGAVSRRPRR